MLVGLVALGTLPLAAALVLLALQVRSAGSPAGSRPAFDEIAQSAHRVISTIDTAALSPAGRAALRAHAETIARQTTLARRAETLSRTAAGAEGALLFVVAVVIALASLILARRWARDASAPIEQLVRWVRAIERGASIPDEPPTAGPPEFDALRGALREMSAALADAQRRELERERLAAFRETARRVAHEMRGPLTAARLAVRQLEKPDAAAAARTVLDDELQRLEAMAREFAEFGRLPEGVEAPVDVGELLADAVSATVPESCRVERAIASDLMIQGHAEPVRRALQNLLRNAVEATSSTGIEVGAHRTGTASIRVTIADHGPGVPADLRARVFDPYFTTKASGTGLGLALVRQTVLAHGGTIALEETAGGGARFVLEFPAAG